MDNRNELASKVLESTVFTNYLDKKKAAESNAPLYAMIQEYDRTTEALMALLQGADYDPAEAIRLTNDAEYLSAEIQKHPDVQALNAANEELQAYLACCKQTCSGCDACSHPCNERK